MIRPAHVFVWLIAALLGTAALHAQNAQGETQGGGQPPSGGTGQKDAPFGKKGQGGSGYKPMEKPKLPKVPVDMPNVEDPDFVAARQLFWSGSYDQAEKLFLAYSAKNPDHEPTKVFLRMIRESRHFDPEKERMVRKALEEVRFKRIDWKDMTLDAAISYLREETRRQIPEGETVNFVNLVPPASDPKKITLSAEDATLQDLIKRISDLAGVYHHVESDGVVFETKARSI